MTIDISNNNPRISYSVASGVTQTSFAIPFEFFDDGDVVVYVDDTEKTYGSDYTISGQTLNLSVTGASGGSNVVIVRHVPLERNTDFIAGQDINRAALNEQLDTIVAQIADLDDKVDRTIHLTDSEVPPSMLLTSDRKGRVLAFNSSTGDVEAGPTISDVQSVSDAAADIQTLAHIEDGTDATDAIQTVAGISANVATVANISSNVTTVAGNTSNINAVAADDADIGTVAADIANVNTVAGISANVTTVATNIADVTSVADNMAEVLTADTNAATATTKAAEASASATAAAASETAASTSESNAATSATNASSSASAAATSATSAQTAQTAAETAQAAAELAEDNAEIREQNATTSALNAATYAQNAATSATAASTAQTAAEAAQAAAELAADNFDDTYLGSKSSDPTVDNDGGALNAGDLYFNTTDNNLKVYSGSAWQTAALDSSSFVETAGDTMTGNLSFGDNDKAIFGAGSDLQIYHDGSTSYIRNINNNNLMIAGSDLFLKSNDLGQTYFHAVESGAISINSTTGTNLTVGGANKLQVTSTGIDVTGEITADGLTVVTSSLPTITLQDTDVSANAKIEADGNGTLNLYAAENSGSGILRLYTAGDQRLRVANNGDISFYEDTGTTAKFFWDASAESLTLGASAEPSVSAGELNLVGGSTTNNTAQAALSFFDGGSNDLVTIKSYRGSSFSNGELAFEVAQGGAAPVEAMRIDSSGSVGIGTSSPKNSLSIGVASGAEGVAFQSSDNNYNSIWYSRGGGNLVLGTMLRGSTTVSNGFVSSNSGNFGKSAAEFGYGTIRFFTDPASAVTEGNAFTPSEAMRIDSSGNVGIGTSSPDAKLDVEGGRTFLQSSSGDQYVLRLTNPANVSGVFLGNPENNSLAVYTAAGTERMRIDSSGRVGIGTSSPSGPLHVTGGYSYFDAGGGNTLRIGFDNNNDIYTTGFLRTTAASHLFKIQGSGEAMRIDSSGNLLVGKTSISTATVGHQLLASGLATFTRDGGEVAVYNRLSSDGEIIDFRKDGSTVGSIGVSSNAPYLVRASVSGVAIASSGQFIATLTTGVGSDNTRDLGAASVRWDDVYATNGTIQTSDRNEKQDIAALTATEMLVAARISAMFKTFRWIDSVADNPNARTHTGIIAQDVQQAFTDEGLDAGDYSLFISTTWWEANGETYDTQADAPEGATERTRMGIRYPELLSFIAAYNDQRFASIEARLTALEAN